jgi:hypothetical protein
VCDALREDAGPVVADADDHEVVRRDGFECALGTGVVGDVATTGLVIVMIRRLRLVGCFCTKRSIGASPFALPQASSGRRPIRLQMRAGFSAPSSRNENDAPWRTSPPDSSST